MSPSLVRRSRRLPSSARALRACAFVGVIAAACTTAPDKATHPRGGATRRGDAAARADDPIQDEAFAYFAGGCFWGVEHFMERIDGVASVESGYMGGTVDRPTYAQVSAHATGHVEAVRVRYDAARVRYEALAKRFFEIHDPTQTDGQGPDLGDQYLSVIFYETEEERQAAQTLIAKLRARGYDVATRIERVSTFWPAEDDHQDYYAKTQKTPYCHTPVARFDIDAKDLGR